MSRGHEDIADDSSNAEADHQKHDYPLRRHSPAVEQRHRLCKRVSPTSQRMLEEQVGTPLADREGLPVRRVQ